MFLEGWETVTISLDLISNRYGLTMPLSVCATKVIPDVWVLGGEARWRMFGSGGCHSCEWINAGYRELEAVKSDVVFLPVFALLPCDTSALFDAARKPSSKAAILFYIPQPPAFLFFINYLVSGIQL